jgi:hypothetical protein
MPEERIFREDSASKYIRDVIGRELLERLLDSHCFLIRAVVAIYYPTKLLSITD